MDDIHEFWKIKTRDRTYQAGLASMQKGVVIMDLTTPEQARFAESAGADAVMALQAVPADINKAGGVDRMLILRSYSKQIIEMLPFS